MKRPLKLTRARSATSTFEQETDFRMGKRGFRWRTSLRLRMNSKSRNGIGKPKVIPVSSSASSRGPETGFWEMQTVCRLRASFHVTGEERDGTNRLTVGHPTSGRDFFSTHFDINYLPENQAPHGGTLGDQREWRSCCI